MYNSLGRPPKHLEGTLKVQKGIVEKFAKGSWKDRFVLVLKNELIVYDGAKKSNGTKKIWRNFDLTKTEISDAIAESVPQGYSVNWTFRLCCDDEIWTFLAVDSDEYKFWFDGLLYVKKFWITRMNTNTAPNAVSKSLKSDEFLAKVIDINGCRRDILVKKDAKFNDFYKVWTVDDKKEARSSRSSFHALKEKSVQLWRVDKIHGESMIRRNEEIYPYVEEGCQLFLLEKSYKLIVIFFDDCDVIAAPVQPTITTAEVAELPLIMEKLAEKDLSDCHVLIKRNLDAEIDVSLKDDDKPMEIFYKFEHGVGRRKTDVNAKLLYRKRAKADSKESEAKACAISNIPKDAPDLLPVHRTPIDRGRSPIQAMFSGLLNKTVNPIESKENCGEESMEKLPSYSVVSGACAEVNSFEESAPDTPGHSPVSKEFFEGQRSMPQNTPIDPYEESILIHGPGIEDVNVEAASNFTGSTDESSKVGDTDAYQIDLGGSAKGCLADTDLPDDSGEIKVQGAEGSDEASGVEGEVEIGDVENHDDTLSSSFLPIIDNREPIVRDEDSIAPAIWTPNDSSTGKSDVNDHSSSMGTSDEDHVAHYHVSSIAIHPDNSFVDEKKEIEQNLGDSPVNPDIAAKEEATDDIFAEGHSESSAVLKREDFTSADSGVEKSHSGLAKQIRDLSSPICQDLQSCSRLRNVEKPNNVLKAESGSRLIAAQVHVSKAIKTSGIPVVGESKGMILPTMDELSHQKPSKSHDNALTLEAKTILQVTDGIGSSSGGQVLPTMPDRSSPQDSGLGSNSYDNTDAIDDYDSDGSDSSSVMSIESAMESLGKGSYRSEEMLDQLSGDHSLTVAQGDAAAGTVLQLTQSGSQQEVIDEIADTSAAPMEQSVYQSNDKKEGSVRGRRGAFKANVYEKEATIQRVQRKRHERMKEEAKLKREEGAKLEETKLGAAKLEEARLEEARLEGTEREEARPGEARPEEVILGETVKQEAEQREHGQAMQVDGKQSTLPTVANINGSTGVLDDSHEKRPSSSLKNRSPCPTCQICSLKPFQVLKYNKMNDVLRMSSESGYNYLCLSGVHIKKVDETWILTDSTVFHTESELTDSLDSISLDASRSSGNMVESGSIASKVKKEKNIKLNGGICCHWIPGNGGKWRVTQFEEDHLQPMRECEDERLRPIPSPCFGASATEANARDSRLSGDDSDQPAPGRFNVMGSAISRKVKSTYRDVNASVKDVFSSQKPSQEIYMPLEILQFSERYVAPLGKIVAAIGQQFSGVQRRRYPQQIGDDSVNTDLGWLVRRDFCTALFSLVLHEVKRDNSIARLFMGRTNKFSLWSLIKDVSRACVEESVLQNLVSIIQQSPFLFDDDLRARNFVCETLNWYNEAFTEKLLITWLRSFIRLHHIIDKYFEKTSIWKRPSREVAAVTHQTFSILSQLNKFHFNLHADFEHKQLAMRVRDQNMAFILQREPKSIDMNVATME